MDGPLLWYLNRSTGFVLLALLTLSVLFGIMSTGTTGGRAGQGLPRFVTQAVHRNISLLSVLLLAAHVLTAVIDTFVDIRWWQAIVPFGATYQPFWLGLGTFALDLMAAVVLTSIFRTRVSYRAWQLIHLSSYLCWAVAVVHGVGIGTDMSRDDPWGLIVTAVCVALVLLAGGWRLARLAFGRGVAQRSAA
ncbi:ferric reductase-like transmembrane domain-containing protein [Nocardioides sp.]|uniref:ferric reductase-like transmembrane domain-containing protein n=1 Tax=Nocardioides sp. TaxID=35761 RepID=UPI003D0E5667